MPTEAYDALRKHFGSYDIGVLIMMEKLCLALKSMMLTVMVAERKLEIKEAVRLRFVVRGWWL